jgi:thiol:disulfide interchange protein DsbA
MAKKKQKIPEKKSGLKTIYIILAFIIISGLAIYVWNSGENSSEKVPAGDYTKLNKPSTYESGKVKIMEFMKFDCSHCYNLHNNMPQLLKNYTDKLEITYIPIIFPGQSTKSIEAYIIAEQMGKGTEMQDALFKAEFEQKMDVMESTIALETIAANIGLGSDFNQKLESGALKNAASENLKLMNDYNVDGTPTVIINGNLMVVPTITNLDTVIGSILQQGS